MDSALEVTLPSRSFPLLCVLLQKATAEMPEATQCFEPGDCKDATESSESGLCRRENRRRNLRQHFFRSIQFVQKIIGRLELVIWNRTTSKCYDRKPGPQPSEFRCQGLARPGNGIVRDDQIKSLDAHQA